MGWAAPLFLTGLALLALPWWLHRRQERSAERQPFPSSLLLEASEKPLRASKRIQYWLLLALRLAAIALLCFAFSEPYRNVSGTSHTGASSATLLLDDSLSMRGLDRPAMAAELADLAPADTRWSVVAADGDRTLASDIDTQAMRALVSDLEPGFGRSDYGAMMRGVAVNTNLPRDIYVLTDQQASALPNDLTQLSPAGINSVSVASPPLARDNLWIERVLVGQREATVYAGPGSDGRSVSWWLDDQQIGSSVLGRGRATLELPTMDTRRYRLEVRLDSDDAIATDNRYYVVIDKTPALSIPVIARSPSSLPTFLTAALGATGAGSAASSLSVDQLDWRTLARYPWVVLDDPGALTPPQTQALDNYVRRGGSVLLLVGAQTAAAAQLPLLAWPVSEEPQTQRTTWSANVLATDHPLTAGLENWSSVRVFRRTRIEPVSDGQPLIVLDDGAPLLLATRRGQGQVVTMTTRVDPNWSDLGSRSAFVTLVATINQFFGNGEWSSSDRLVGDTLTTGVTREVITPGGQRISTATDSPFLRLNQPGFYTVYSESATRLIAVNVDRRESLLGPMEETQRQRWEMQRDPIRAVVQDGESDLTESDRHPLARVLLWLLLIILGVESVHANMTGNRKMALGG